MPAQSNRRVGALRVVTAAVGVVTTIGLLSGCMFSSLDASLPGSEGVVNDENPLTSIQADRVATAGSSLTTLVVEPLLTMGYRSHNAAATSERWNPCHAEHVQLYSNGDHNGAMYVTWVPLEAPHDVPFTALAGTLSAIPGITWDRKLNGEAGVFTVKVQTKRSLSKDHRFAAVRIASPCYFIRKVRNGGQGSLGTDDVALVTGFVNRGLQLPS